MGAKKIATYTRMSCLTNDFDTVNYPEEQGLYVVSLRLDEYCVINGVNIVDGDAVAFFHEDLEVFINENGTLTASFYDEVDDDLIPTELYLDELGNLILKYVEDDGNS
jgi:hypothetical protein